MGIHGGAVEKRALLIYACSNARAFNDRQSVCSCSKSAHFSCRKARTSLSIRALFSDMPEMFSMCAFRIMLRTASYRMDFSYLDIHRPSLPTPFYSVLVQRFLSLWSFQPFFHSVLPVLPLPYWSFQL